MHTCCLHLTQPQHKLTKHTSNQHQAILTHHTPSLKGRKNKTCAHILPHKGNSAADRINNGWTH